MGLQEQCGLLTLPPEIQTKILSHLAVFFGKSSIHAVLKTCKQLYEIALPLTVKVFRNTVPWPGTHGPCSPARNIQFLRYILITKPWLAKHVKTAILGRFSTDHRGGADGNETAQGQESIDREELAVYQQYIQLRLRQLASGDTASWCDSWVEDLGNGTSDAQIALILLACPNIRTLYFEVSDSNHFVRLLRMVRDISARNDQPGERGSGQDDGHCTKTSVPLCNLQEVFHEQGGFAERQQDFHIEASELFALPRLRIYEALGVQGTETAAASFETLPLRASPVEQITLSNSFCTWPIWHILGSCKELKKFEFSWYKPPWLEAPNLLMPVDIMNAVWIHRHTLEYLYLDLYEELDHRWDPDESDYERLYLGMRLREMRSLKTLVVGMQALTGMLASKPRGHHNMPLKVEGAPRMVDCLPDSLQCITIHSCGEAILDQLQELVNCAWQGRLKKLSYICVLYDDWRANQKEIWEWHQKFPKRPEGGQPTITAAASRTKDASMHDSFGVFSLSDKGPFNAISKIYAPHLRRQYLERRMNIDYWNAEYNYQDDPNLFDDTYDKGYSLVWLPKSVREAVEIEYY
ncbi:unnamed protein product [Clonostachys byssicola]|uniref:Leucine-rich repeat domain-containing protein n=1 Tax=Clonostachys byssicola TaxID=160290 RepID=A0A9N9XVC5_9HYPO|nr:unnamed protein product [Clonostachys byssicola]